MSTTLPEPAAVAAAYIASPEFAELWGKMEAAFKVMTWEVVEYEQSDPTVRVYSWPRPVHVERTFDLLGEERLNTGEADPGDVTRKAYLRSGIKTDILQEFFDYYYMEFWNRTYPAVRRPQSGDRDGHVHEVATLVREHVCALLDANPDFDARMGDFYALLSSPEVAAKSKGRREQHGTSRLEQGVSALRKIGWTDEAILDLVRRELAGET